MAGLLFLGVSPIICYSNYKYKIILFWQAYALKNFIDVLEKKYSSPSRVLITLVTLLAPTLFTFIFSEIALGQNKFFGTPNRGVEGSKGNAQIKALNDRTSRNREDIQALENTIDTSLTTVIEDVGVLQAAVDASLTVVSECGNLGMLGGPEHPTANAQDCLPSLVIETTGETVFSEPSRHQQGLVLGDNPTCDLNTEGMLRYISTEKSVMLCTGTTWVEVGAAPAASGVYPPVTDANLNQSYTSNTVTLSGFFGVRTATATNGAIIVVNGVSQGASANVEAGDSVALRMTSSTTFNTAKSTTLNLSSYSQTWTITTKPQDTTPNPFSFTDLSDQSTNALVTSNSVNVSGFDGPLTASVSGSGNPQLQVAGGAWANSAPINPGQSLRIRLTTSEGYDTSYTATVQLGAISTAWSAMTKAGTCTGMTYWSGSECVPAPEGCPKRQYCVQSPQTGLSPGTFIKNYMWDSGSKCGNDVCYSCSKSSIQGVPLADPSIGANQCASGKAICVRSTVAYSGCSGLLATGYCYCA